MIKSSRPSRIETPAKTQNPLVRGVWYLLAISLLVPITAMILVAMFTNNWQKTASKLRTKFEYESYGIWFMCRHVSIDWLNNNQDVFCSTIDFKICMRELF